CEPSYAIFDYCPINRRAIAAHAFGDRADGPALPVGAQNGGALLLIKRRRGGREDRGPRILLIVLANRMKNGERRTIEAPAKATCDFALAAAACLCQPARAAQNFFALAIGDLRKIRSVLELVLVRMQKPLDTAEQKSYPPLAVGID